MTRTSVLIGLVAVLGVAGLPAVAGGAEDPTTLAELGHQIQAQTDATAEAVALADSPWLPRTAGLGVGLAVGLLGGGLVAYATRRGNG